MSKPSKLRGQYKPRWRPTGWITVTMAATQLGESPDSIRKRASAEKWPRHEVRGQNLVAQVTVDAYAAQRDKDAKVALKEAERDAMARAVENG